MVPDDTAPQVMLQPTFLKSALCQKKKGGRGARRRDTIISKGALRAQGAAFLLHYGNTANLSVNDLMRVGSRWGCVTVLQQSVQAAAITHLGLAMCNCATCLRCLLCPVPLCPSSQTHRPQSTVLHAVGLRMRARLTRVGVGCWARQGEWVVGVGLGRGLGCWVLGVTPNNHAGS
jgi:hypothetical protein